jgi:hypothetical protein
MKHYGLITVGRIDRAVLQAVAYAKALQMVSLEAVFITDDPQHGHELRKEWQELGSDVRLVVLESPTRSTTSALERYLDFIQKHVEPNCFVTVILPEIQPTRWWHPLVHNYLAWRVKWVLLFRARTAVTSVPHEIHD